MPPMLSIDFGNSHTKVALRTHREARTETVKDASLVWDEFNVCVPTLAAEQLLFGQPVWHFGTDATRFAEGTPGLNVHRNWKPHFFSKGTIEPRAKVSTAGAKVTRSAPPGIASEAWSVMSATLEPQQLDLLWNKLGGTSDASDAPDEITEPEHKVIGLGFFRWLREFVDPVCVKRMGTSAADIPARISLPSFGNMTKAELLLREILAEAGWRLDDTAPVLPEPLSNAIGAFTEGANALRPKKQNPDYAAMFRQTGMLKRMREAILGRGVKVAWALIVDVGGYTTDFAMVGIDLQDIDARLVVRQS